MSDPTAPVADPDEQARPVGPLWLYRMFHVPSSKGYPACHNFLSLMIFVATIGSALETVDSLAARYDAWFQFCEVTVTVIFALEYVAHLITTRRKLGYIFSFWGIIDLMAILPSFFQVANVTALKSARMLRVLRVLRVMRVLKLARETVDKMGSDVREEMRRSPLRINLVIYCLAMFSVIIISSTLEYYAEYTHGEVETVERATANTLRFHAGDLPADAPGSKITIIGGSPFDGTWEVKSWNPGHGSFDVVLPDAEIVALAPPEPLALTGSDGTLPKWTRDTPFTSVPQTMWWCMTTLTTVGYGDMYPVTVWGRIVASATMLCGLVLFGMLMNIVGKAMMVALFGSEHIDEASLAPPAAGSDLHWDPRWRHCPTCGHHAGGSHEHPGNREEDPSPSD